MSEELNLSIEETNIEIPMDERLKENPPIQPPTLGKFDPLDGLSKEEEYTCIEKAVQKVKETHDKELSLMKSNVRMPNQEYMVCSFVGPKSKQKTEQCGMKCFGTFPDLTSANKWAKFVGNTEENKDFDVYVLEMYCWCLIPPDPESCEDVQYHEKKLDTLIRQHKAQKYKSQEVFDLRKQKLIANKNKITPQKSAAIETQLNSNVDFMNDLQRKTIIPSEKMPKMTMEVIEEDHDDFIPDAKSGLIKKN